MNKEFSSIINALKAKEFVPIYFLHGAEPYFIDEISNYIEKNALNEAEKSFNQVVMYGKEVDFKQVTDHARQFPMMASYRVVIVKEAQEMRSLSDLLSYFLKPSPQTILVINYKYKTLDKRKKLYKALSNAKVFESKKLYDNQLAPFIRDFVNEIGFKINDRAVILIIEYIGSNLQKIKSELTKVAINLTKGEEIKVAPILEQIGVSKEYNIFELQKAIGFKEIEKVTRIFNYFSENSSKTPIQMILPSLYQYIMKVLVTKSNLGQTDRHIQSQISLGSSYFVREYKTAAMNYTHEDLQKILIALSKADRQSKGMGARNLSNSDVYKELVLVFN